MEMTQVCCSFPHLFSKKASVFLICNFSTEILGTWQFFLVLQAAQAGRIVKWGSKEIKEVARNQVQGSFRFEGVKLKDNFCYMIL